MNILLTTGCICDSLMIDDKEARDYSIDDLKEITKKILELEKSKANLINLLNSVVEIFGECSTSACIAKTDKYGVILTTEQDDKDVITIGGKNANKFTKEEIRDVIINVVSADNDNADLIWALRGFISNFGEYKFCYHCDECGDNVTEYKLKI